MGLMAEIKICTWNTRGFNSSSKIKMVNKFASRNNISIFVALETKIAKDKEDGLAMSLIRDWRFSTNSTGDKKKKGEFGWLGKKVY